jgi:hypothetical protein
MVQGQKFGKRLRARFIFKIDNRLQELYNAGALIGYIPLNAMKKEKHGKIRKGNVET